MAVKSATVSKVEDTTLARLGEILADRPPIGRATSHRARHNVEPGSRCRLGAFSNGDSTTRKASTRFSSAFGPFQRRADVFLRSCT
ncbi:hypothetical protein BASA81_013778 [Batrachochytrium salamandrivorans]|nr:hypothetical protein BASA81_013778 [Batrachochytrium salamandrivorans]